MRPLARSELVDLETYEALRPDFRETVIALKRDRRVGIGDRVTLLFENRETIRFQVQEMLRVERIREPGHIQRELDVYNELIPRAGELSATLFIEITDLAKIKPELDRLVAIDEHVWLVLGEGTEEEAIGALFDPKQMEADRIAAVQYIRFPFDDAQRARLADPEQRARLRIDHANYTQEAEISPPLRASLVADLSAEPEPLLAAPEPPWEEDTEEVLHEDERVRVLRPARPGAPGHLIVEARSAELGLLEAGPEALAGILEVVRRHARALRAEHGSCRVVTRTPASRPRWHLFGGDTR